MRKLNFFGFYSDCYHEIKKVTEGYRVTLTYNVSVVPPKVSSQSSPKINNQKPLSHAIQSYFEKPTSDPSKHGDQSQKRKIVYLLNHQYTPKSLSPNMLKGVDNYTFHALKQISSELGLSIFLVLANTHEIWNCVDEKPFGTYYYDDDDDDYIDSKGEHELVELIEKSTDLNNWRSCDGKRLNYGEIGVSDNEIFFGKPNNQFTLYNEEYEGFMGNYGNTLDRWYHRAAIVLWSKEKHFDLMHRVGPEYVMSLIEEAFHCGDKKNLKKIVTAWKNLRTYHSSGDKKLLKRSLSITKNLQDPQLSKKILCCFDLTDFKSNLITPFLNLSESYGESLCCDIMEHWYNNCLDHTDILNSHPHVLSLIKKSNQKNKWKSLHKIVSQRGALVFIESCEMESKHSTPVSLKRDMNQRSQWAYLTLSICQEANNKEAHNMLMEFLFFDADMFPPESLFITLQSLQKDGDHSALKKNAINTLTKQIKNTLAEYVDKGLRGRNDWSIEEKVPCSCNDCKQLKSFLESSNAQMLRLPMATDRRKHLHQQINSLDIHVSHETHRTGSPYTLVLKKLPSIFEKEKKIFQRRKSWLKSLL